MEEIDERRRRISWLRDFRPCGRHPFFHCYWYWVPAPRLVCVFHVFGCVPLFQIFQRRNWRPCVASWSTRKKRSWSGEHARVGQRDQQKWKSLSTGFDPFQALDIVRLAYEEFQVNYSVILKKSLSGGLCWTGEKYKPKGFCK